MQGPWVCTRVAIAYPHGAMEKSSRHDIASISKGKRNVMYAARAREFRGMSGYVASDKGRDSPGSSALAAASIRDFRNAAGEKAGRAREFEWQRGANIVFQYILGQACIRGQSRA